MTCIDCGSDAAPETETIEDPAQPGRMTTVSYCPDCGEVGAAL